MTKAKIYTLTPVHIGNGIELQQNIEFLFDKNERKIAVIDDKKVLNIIGEENIDKWVSIINNNESLFSYLKKRKNDFSLSDVAKRQMNVYGSNIQNNKSLKLQMLNGTGLPTIPGSSIKGAIRTAVLSNIILNKKFLSYNIQTSDIKHINKYGKTKWTAKYIENKIFGKDAKNDVFRFLNIGDAYFNYETIATNMQVLNFTQNNWNFKRGSNQLVEVIGLDAEAELNININKNIYNTDFLKKANISSDISFLNNLETLFEIIKTQTLFLLEKEIHFWNNQDVQIVNIDNYISNLENLLNITKNCKNNETVLRVGHGSGWDFITGAWAKYSTILNDNDWNSLSYKLSRRNAPFFPKTRKMDEDADILGFVKLVF